MRQQELAGVFIEFADTLVDDFDLVDFLYQVTRRCAEVLNVSAAGLLLTDQRGALRVAAASNEESHLLELLQLQHDEGPCPECFHTGRPIAVPDIAEAADRWPAFCAAAAEQGLASVHAFPMRLRSDVIGALNLFDETPGEIDADTAGIGQALTDVATIGILQVRALQRRELLAEQLQGALNSRVIIEQAKGVIAERHGIDVERAFDRLRLAARSSNLRLVELARDIVDRKASI